LVKNIGNQVPRFHSSALHASIPRIRRWDSSLEPRIWSDLHLSLSTNAVPLPEVFSIKCLLFVSKSNNMMALISLSCLQGTPNEQPVVDAHDSGQIAAHSGRWAAPFISPFFQHGATTAMYLLCSVKNCNISRSHRSDEPHVSRC